MKSNSTIRRWALAAALTGAAAVAACYPSPALSIEDFATVVTVVADGADPAAPARLRLATKMPGHFQLLERVGLLCCLASSAVGDSEGSEN